MNTVKSISVVLLASIGLNLVLAMNIRAYVRSKKLTNITLRADSAEYTKQRSTENDTTGSDWQFT